MHTNSQLIEAQGTWLKTFSWDFYFTGTFAHPVTQHGARFRLSEYVKTLEQISGTSLSMYWAVERGPLGGNVHVHGLIGNTGTLHPFCGLESRSCASAACATHLWRVGKAQVSPYYAEGAAPFYISKTIFTRNGEWEIVGNPTPISASVQSAAVA